MLDSKVLGVLSLDQQLFLRRSKLKNGFKSRGQNSTFVDRWRNRLIIHSNQVWRRVKKRSAVEDDIAFHFHFLSCLPYPLISIKVSSRFSYALRQAFPPPPPKWVLCLCSTLSLRGSKGSGFVWGEGRSGWGRLEGSRLFCPPKCSPFQGSQ